MSEEAVGVPRRRNIVLFSDGTGNSVNSIFRTNVRRLYDALDLEDTDPTKYPRQFAFYDDGVGTSSFRPLAMLGGAFGFGLARNVREIYAFLCRTWRPGDEIYGFGFSRGAFTMRVVMGLVMNQGIVRYDGSEANLQRQVNEAWRAYRRERYRGRVLTEIARPVRDAVIWAKNALLGVPSYDPKANSGGPGEPDQRTKVRFLGCFDTVDAYGLPIAELTRAMDAVVYPVTMPDADLNDRVRRACQALSLDDERSTFYPRLWNEAKEPPAGEDIGRERISQVWFAGMHSDVGGGYADDGLAHTPLIWMLEQAEAAGLRFAPAVKDLFRAVADEHGPIHDSRRGFASYFRYKPRRLDAILHQSRAQSGRPDVEVARPKIHESVFNRIKAGQDGYAPISLPADFDVLKANGSLVTADQFLGPGLWNGSAAARERVWNWVWWRRVAYFWTLASTVALAGAPFLLKPTGCESWACFLKPVIEAGSGVLPAMLAQPFSVYGSHPVTLLVLAACLLAGILAGRWLDTRVPDEMRCVWYDLGPVTTPVRPAKGGFVVPRPAGLVNRAVQALRLSGAYRLLDRVARRWLLPWGAGLAAIWLTVGLLNQSALGVMQASGSFCTTPGNASLVTPSGRSDVVSHFDTRSICHPTLVQMEQGATYRLRIQLGDTRASPDAPRDWKDASLPAGPHGLSAGAGDWKTALLMGAAIPLRRHVTQDWFRLMARIGEVGGDDYALDWRLLPGGRTYEATLSARRDGPLFLYVNDLLVPGIAETYGNNCGTARLRVRLLGGVEGGAEAEGGAMREIPLPPNYGRGNPACTTSRGGAPPSQ